MDTKEDLDKDLEEAERCETNDGRTPKSGSENIKVMVRCRPYVPRKVARPELGSAYGASFDVRESDNCILVTDRQFSYDTVFGPQCDNEQVYSKSTKELVEFAFKGYNCTIFLYGQTGTGKTYTHSSLTSRSFAHLFDLMGSSTTRTRFLIRASYYELYNEEIRDLLSKSSKPLELKESKDRGVFVKDLTCFLVNDVDELEKLKRLGDKKRSTGATKMNDLSSRSHSLFCITIETIAPTLGSASKTPAIKRQVKPTEQTIRVGRLNLIDLAGSERQSKSESSGSRLKEASKINLSLTCLSLVIRALTDPGNQHIPYRNSKLTRILSGSLGGNSKTLLLACVSLAKADLDETLNTLRFASRAKRIKNTASINEDAKDALLRNYKQQIEELRERLRRQQQSLEPTSDDEIIESLVVDRRGGPSGDDRDTLAQQLKLLKAKIIVGGENLLEKAELHEKLLEENRTLLARRQEAAAKLREKLEFKKGQIERMTKSKGGLEDQMGDLEQKLKRAQIILKRTRDEHRDALRDNLDFKNNLLQSIRTTSKEIRYTDCIIEDFIPRDYLHSINSHANYDDQGDEWQIKYVALSGNNTAQMWSSSSSSTGPHSALHRRE